MHYGRAITEVCIYMYMLNGKHTDVPVMHRWTYCMVVALKSKHPWTLFSNKLEIQWSKTFADCF